MYCFKFPTEKINILNGIRLVAKISMLFYEKPVLEIILPIYVTICKYKLHLMF